MSAPPRTAMTRTTQALVLTLVGVTYLFALAKDNGTVDWLVAKAVRSVGGRVAVE